MFRSVLFVCSLMIVVVETRRDIYEEKCKRHCTAVDGSVNCWRETADGFAYGLASAMTDYCQIILKFVVFRMIGLRKVKPFSVNKFNRMK